jgi:hypothetical protein
MTVPDPSVMVNTEPGSPVPFIVGVLSLVMSPSVGLAIVGVTGVVVSIVRGRLTGLLTFPAVSVVMTEYG